MRASEHRTIWVFPDDGHWYEVGLPYDAKFAAALGRKHDPAWRVLLGVIEQVLEAAR